MQVCAVDVGDEVHLDSAVGKGFEGFDGHAGPEVASADADVDDVLKFFSGCGPDVALADRFSKVEHAVAFAGDEGSHVVAVDEQGFG